MKTPERTIRTDVRTTGIETAIQSFRYPKPERRQAAWPAAAGLVATVALALAAIPLTIREAQASPFVIIAQAERNAPRCTVSFYDGDSRLWGRGWQEGQRARFDIVSTSSTGSVRATDGRRIWFVNHDSRTAVITTNSARIVAPLIQKITEYGGTQVAYRKRDDGAIELTLERTASQTSLLQRDEIVTDPQSRPISVNHLVFKAGQWQVTGREVRAYEAPIGEQVFAYRPPAGYESYDLDANLNRLREGLKSGPVQSSVRLVGALQDRHGTVTAVYTGGGSPSPRSVGWAEREGRRYAGYAVVGEAPDPRAGKPRGIGLFGWPTHLVRAKTGMAMNPDPKPFARLDGVDLQIVRFELPKILGNRPREVRLTLPAGDRSATFRTVPIASNAGEEIYRLPSSKRSAYEVRLAMPTK